MCLIRYLSLLGIRLVHARFELLHYRGAEFMLSHDVGLKWLIVELNAIVTEFVSLVRSFLSQLSTIT